MITKAALSPTVVTKEFISKTTPPHPCPLPPGERGSIISPPSTGGD